MSYATPKVLTIKGCFQNHYSLPDFQRAYKWEARHFTELINDLQAAFIQQFDPAHMREEVANYTQYFLGSTISTTEVDGKKSLIDGQQRLTSLFIIISFLERYRNDQSITDVDDLATLLGGMNFGKRQYRLEFSSTRKELFDRYLNKSKSTIEALNNAEDIQNLDTGDKKILEALRSAEGLLDSKVRDGISYFIDFFLHRVELIDITVPSETEAHRIFVTMNDRGLRLGPLDLLKAKILSHIRLPDKAAECNRAWMDVINRLRQIDHEEDSLFFRTLFRAKWAQTIRGKSKGDPAGDFDLIGDEYHRWFDQNISLLNIATSDDYFRFSTIDIPKFANIYLLIKDAEEAYSASHKFIYYNAVRRNSLQSMVLLSCIDVNDRDDVWNEKIELASRLLDIILTSRTIDGKENSYDNLKDLSFILCKDLRGKDSSALLSHVRAVWSQYADLLQTIPKLRYDNTKRPDMLFLLSRIATELEVEFKLKSSVGFETFIKRDRGNSTFDVEHLLKEAYDPSALPVTHGFANNKDYAESRHLIGALALLGRSRNRSLQDASYRDKLNTYTSENVLVMTLCSGFYTNHPDVTNFLQMNPSISLQAIVDFDKHHIQARANAYVAIAERVWAKP